MDIVSLYIYAVVVTVICGAALYNLHRALKVSDGWRRLYLRVFNELAATRASAQVISLWERDREEQSEEAWLS